MTVKVVPKPDYHEIARLLVARWENRDVDYPNVSHRKWLRDIAVPDVAYWLGNLHSEIEAFLAIPEPLTIEHKPEGS